MYLFLSTLRALNSVAKIWEYETMAKDDRGVRKCFLFPVEIFLWIIEEPI
jgi:hypothetical protein